MITKTKSTVPTAKNNKSAQKPATKIKKSILPQEAEKDCCCKTPSIPHESIQTHAYFLSKERQHNGTPGCSNTDWHMAKMQLQENSEDYAI